jgi:hypothetical protein
MGWIIKPLGKLKLVSSTPIAPVNVLRLLPELLLLELSLLPELLLSELPLSTLGTINDSLIEEKKIQYLTLNSVGIPLKKPLSTIRTLLFYLIT